MARPISWQSRLRDIHRLVSESARTPYTRGDLEKLFKVGAAAASQLQGLMPRIGQANAMVVEREDLLAFLGGALDAEDLAGYLNELKKNPPKPKRRKLRLFVPGNYVAGNLQSNVLRQHDIWLERGKLDLRWTTFDDFMSKMAMLIQSLEDPAFERRFCEEPPAPKADAESKEDVETLFAELADLEAERARSSQEI